MQQVFLLFMFGLFVNEICDRQYMGLLKWHGFKWNSNYCSKLLMITFAWLHRKVVLSLTVCYGMDRWGKESLEFTRVESICELPDYFARWIAFFTLRKALTASYARHYMNKWSIFWPQRMQILCSVVKRAEYWYPLQRMEFSCLLGDLE